MAINPMEQFEVKPLIPIHLGGYDISFTNQSLWMVVVVISLSLFLILSVSKGRIVPTRAQSLAELSYEFIGGMIDMTAGPAGLRFFPLIFTIFMFILFCNGFGLLPIAFTVTSQIAITLALTMLVILTAIVTGFARHGLGFFKLFVIKAPLIIVIPMILLEFISFCARPLSLSMRLFANMLAGHTMLKVMAGFVIALGTAGGAYTVLAAAPEALIVGLTALEFLVAFLQAYVFAILSCIYLSEALHLHDNH
ncbi:MAG TPA: F0F1 ATP synthase subunit A [Rhizomicrobium sp.]|jgi:F-type H+-transporting ATPase subunit a|nr:F0F1 ATP synthase subunit A [Rhizomicrobium sp.]